MARARGLAISADDIVTNPQAPPPFPAVERQFHVGIAVGGFIHRCRPMKMTVSMAAPAWLLAKNQKAVDGRIVPNRLKMSHEPFEPFPRANSIRGAPPPPAAANASGCSGISGR